MSMFTGQAVAAYAMDGTYKTTAGKAPLVFGNAYNSKKRTKKVYKKSRKARINRRIKRSAAKRASKRRLNRTASKRSVRKTRKIRKVRRNRRVSSRRISKRRIRNTRRNRRVSSRRLKRRSKRRSRRRVSNRRAYRGRSGNLRAILRRVKPAGLPYALAAAVVTVESRWRVNARGASGEYGLMQLMPATARHLGLRGNPYNPTNNMRAGTKYLYRCYRRARGSVPLTIGCYNRGPGNMHGWNKNPITRRYVAKVRRLMRRRG